MSPVQRSHGQAPHLGTLAGVSSVSSQSPQARRGPGDRVRPWGQHTAPREGLGSRVYTWLSETKIRFAHSTVFMWQ